MKMYMIEAMPARRRRQRNPEPNPPFGLEWSQLGIGAVVVGLAVFALYTSSKSKQIETPPVTPPVVPPGAPPAKGYFVAEGIWYRLEDWKARLGHTPAAIEWIRAIHLETKLSETVSGKVYDRLLEFWRVFGGNNPTAEQFTTIVREVGAQNGWAESTGTE